jgi:hypothetical protein
MRRPALDRLLVSVLALAAGCAFAAASGAETPSYAVRPEIVKQLAALDCDNVDAVQVRDVLASVPAPRIVLLQGSVAVVTMEPFAQFLIGMGYPEDRLRNPADGRVTYSSYADSAALAGALAYDFEQSGVEPMLIGHSQGGMLAIRVLYELAGAFHDALPVVDPATGAALPRTAIVDPRTGQPRPVVGLHVAYAAALATGWLPRVLLGQWSMLSRLRRIPDTVTEFTGFDIPNDPIAGNLLGITPYEAIGTARVRNVLLPASYGHIDLPRAGDLPGNDRARAWIDAWQPDARLPADIGELPNIVHAADVWHSVKRHWCGQAQRLLTRSSS